MLILNLQVFDAYQWYLVPNIAVMQPFSKYRHIDTWLRLLHPHLPLYLFVLRVYPIGKKSLYVHFVETVAAAAFVSPDLAPIISEKRLVSIILSEPLVAPLFVVGSLGIEGFLSHRLCVL